MIEIKQSKIQNPELEHENSLLTKLINDAAKDLARNFDYDIKLKISKNGFKDIENMSLEDFFKKHHGLIKNYPCGLNELYIDGVMVTYWNDHINITQGINSINITMGK